MLHPDARPHFNHHESEDPVPPRGTLDRFLLRTEQTGWAVAYVAGVRIGGHAGPAHTPGLGLVEQGQGDLRLGLEGDLLGHMGLGTSAQVFGPVPGQVQPSRDRPAHGTFGIVAVDGDLAVAFLAQGAGVLPGDAHGALALLGEARVIEDQDAVSLAGQSEHLLDTLAVELVLVPSRGGKQALELLFGGAGYARSDGIAVLVGQLGQQPSQVAIQGMSPFAAREMNMERLQERGQLGQWLGGSLRNTNGGLHTPLYARTPKRQSSMAHPAFRGVGVSSSSISAPSNALPRFRTL